MSVALTKSPPPASTRQDKLRVMVVDDSVVIRGMISRWIDAEPDMEVSASLRTGLDAVNQLDRVKPDVAVLDIEMPELDGISALPKLLAKKRDLVIIMASTLTRRNAEISFKALSLGRTCDRQSAARTSPRQGPRYSGTSGSRAGRAAAIDAPRIRHAGAKSAADRIVDRRPAGVDVAGG